MVTFKQLWENHPTITGEGNPCDQTFQYQCAMKLGTALASAGVFIQGVPHCWFKGHQGAGHYRLAEQLAEGLKRTHIPGVQPAQEYPGINFHANILGRTGIIFFKDFWRRKHKGKLQSFRNRSGDHIDLWNGSRTTSWFSWIRIHVRIGDIGIHSVRSDMSDLEDSKAVWFWAVA